MIALGIESTCDDTCVGIVRNGKDILSNIVLSQDNYHFQFKGVVPEIASRRHIETIHGVINEALVEANISLHDIDMIGVSYKPGLLGSLLVGVETAKTLSYSLNKPLLAVNHLKAHVYVPHFSKEEVNYPHVALLVSGGHTLLLYVQSSTNIEIMGSTLDDACGEAYDKIAKYLNIGFPGGELIDKLAQRGDANCYSLPCINLDYKKNRYNFSYSGLKTAFIQLYKKIEDKSSLEDILASFQKQAITVLVEKLKMAAKDKGVKTMSICGGVAQNSLFRDLLKKNNEYDIYIPEPILCRDNGAMVAGLSYKMFKEGDIVSPLEIQADPTPYRYHKGLSSHL